MALISDFTPSQSWYEDWPFDTLTSVRVRARVSGEAAATAVENFTRGLHRDDGLPMDTKTYYWGGYIAEVKSAQRGHEIQITLSSAGEDGFDSVIHAADTLGSVLRETPGELQLRWEELPATKVPDC